MGFFSRFSPVRAYRDLRLFLLGRQAYELGFFALALMTTGYFIYALARDGATEPVYKRDIVYFQQWPADRSDEQIRAQQRIDAPIKARELAEQKAADEKRRAQFKQVDNAMSKWGL